MNYRKTTIAAVLLLGSTIAFAADPLSSLKKLQDDGLGASALAAINACQPLAPAPFGSFVPPNVTLTVPSTTISTPAITIAGPFPITIPALSLTVPTNTVTIPGSAFLPPAPRLCPVSTSGFMAGNPPQPPGQSTFNLQLTIDFSTYRSDGSGGGCSQASGTLSVTKRDNGANQEVLTMTHAGLVCDTSGIGSAKTYTATYHVTGQSGKYVGASGTGSLSAAFDPAHTLIHLDGNVLFQ